MSTVASRIESIVINGIKENISMGGTPWVYRFVLHRDVCRELGGTYQSTGGSFNKTIKSMLESGKIVAKKRGHVKYTISNNA